MTVMTSDSRGAYDAERPNDGLVAKLLIGRTPVMRDLRAVISRVAHTALPVLIEGPTGSGKELVAGAIHAMSGRRGRFVPFNVAAEGETLFEDALFGHVKGAFTGATTSRTGYLMEAHGGTCFLDEIGTLPQALQPKLLRAVDAGCFRAIGAHADSSSDFRLVGATNESLKRLVRLGRFRDDLAFRLGGVTIVVPPLRDRIEDVPILAQHFADLMRARRGATRTWSADAICALQDHDWPGNVRELKHAVERVIAFTDGPVIGAADVRMHGVTLGRLRSDGACDEQRRAELQDVLRSVNWDTGKAAAILAIDRTTVYRRMSRLGIRVPQREAGPGLGSDR